MLDDFIRALVKPERAAGPAAVWRRTVVTGVQGSPARVQVALGGDAWLRYRAWYSPVEGDEVCVLQQGPDMVVEGTLAD
jgi:hypothetical protein